MHTFEFHHYVERFSAESEKIQPFIRVVADLANDVEKMGENLLKIAAGGNSQGDGAARLHAHFARVHGGTSGVSQRQFFRALEHFQFIISQFESQHPKEADFIVDLRHEVERFSDLYDVFITNGSGVNAVHVILAAKDLYLRTSTFMSTLQLVDEHLGDHEVAGSAEAEMTMWLSGHLGLGDFAAQLLALQRMYSELCMLLSVSESQYPIRISKIESGSLWVKLFGESKVIDLLVSSIKACASWGHRNYTAEGRISVIPQKVDAIDELLGLTSRLHAAGIDTSHMDEHIRKSAVVLAKELSTLLDRQANVTINGESFSAGADLTREISRQGVPPRIGSSGVVGRIEPTLSDPESDASGT
ncbi:hypothetical protein MQC82_13530 [Pseudomonas viridiflava]|uniref:hypothetical protein n=1 Tax=Pseudomonas viridiflava TaxID=33069 RepID=UPI001F60F70E|nr:hypothetical protein [Pseudomonas viridiflava]MCI3910587.1 hypothetical protein [Pseudomonas viridiflava]